MNARAVLAEWRNAKREFAACIVVKTWGSSPRQVGSLMLVDDHGSVVGSVSGGCVESAVIECALQCMASGRSVALGFGAVSDESAWEVGLSCGGEIDVWVVPSEVIPENLGPTWEIPHPEGGAPFLWTPEDEPTLIVVGAVHIAQELVTMARQVGFTPWVADPRSALVSEKRFPGMGANMIADWPDAAFAKIGTDERTFVVVLAHDPKIDDPAILLALQANARYVGALGSRKTHDERVRRLRCQGVSEDALTRIRGPVGLAIGAKTPAEIALSILGEMVQVRRGS